MMKIPHFLVIQAVSVVRDLQSWIEDHDGLSTVPQAHLSVTVDRLAIEIAGITVFDTEGDSETELTFDYCRNTFLEEIEMFQPFMQDERTAT